MTSILALVEPGRFKSSIAGGGIELFLDATVREVHRGSTTTTDHPVEDGSVVTDHAIDQPDEIEISGIVSNTLIIPLASATSQPSVPGTDPKKRAEAAFEKIQEFRRTATLLQVSTSLRSYENMLIISESATRDAETGNILNVTIRLRQFRIATVESVPAPRPIEQVHKPETNLGRQQTKPATQEVEEKTTDLFEDVANFFEGLRGAS